MLKRGCKTRDREKEVGIKKRCVDKSHEVKIKIALNCIMKPFFFSPYFSILSPDELFFGLEVTLFSSSSLVYIYIT